MPQLSAVPALAEWLPDAVARRIIEPAAAERGFQPAHLTPRDLFFVKYEARPGVQAGLARHTDGSVLSFNVLLNSAEEFVGGGTHFTHLGRAVTIEQGDCVLHDGKVEHAGVPITSGRRMLLVGFIETTDRPLLTHEKAEAGRADGPRPRRQAAEDAVVS